MGNLPAARQVGPSRIRTTRRRISMAKRSSPSVPSVPTSEAKQPTAAVPPREVSAEQFVLRNAAGAAQASLDLKDSSSPTLSFFDPDGRTRLQLGVDDEGNPGAVLLDADGNTKA